jgi:hypothetical protein
MTTLTRGQCAPLLQRSSSAPRSTLPQRSSQFLRDDLRRARANYFANHSLNRTHCGMRPKASMRTEPMPNRSPEQNLIDAFIAQVETHSNPEYTVKTLHNQRCRAKKFADVEYLAVSGTHWVIEAKSHDSKDKYNTVHKIFGELLKETGRANRTSCHYGVLLPEEAQGFYSKAFQSIAREKYIKFGELVPVSGVFLVGTSGLQVVSWASLYPESRAASGAP